MEIITSCRRMTGWADRRIVDKETICLVPTMGFFHEGHLALMREGHRLADNLVVSLFVNPIQFGPGEDYDSYPRDLEKDKRLARENGAGVLFVPEQDELYPPGFQTEVKVTSLTGPLCGGSRPGHFDGVTTVVAKLFNLIKPHYAVFGEKDFQQLAVIRRMVADLNWDVDIVGHPVVRDSSGLALSSRNSYLDEEGRRKALELSGSLEFAAEQAGKGGADPRELEEEVRRRLNDYPGVEVEYAEIVQADTLEQTRLINDNSLMALAVRVDGVRLIDNRLLLR